MSELENGHTVDEGPAAVGERVEEVLIAGSWADEVGNGIAEHIVGGLWGRILGDVATGVDDIEEKAEGIGIA